MNLYGQERFYNLGATTEKALPCILANHISDGNGAQDRVSDDVLRGSGEIGL